MTQCNLAHSKGGDRELLQDAMKSLDRAIELNPGFSVALKVRGEALLDLALAEAHPIARRKEALQQAISDFEEALHLNRALRDRIMPLLEKARAIQNQLAPGE